MSDTKLDEVLQALELASKALDEASSDGPERVMYYDELDKHYWVSINYSNEFPEWRRYKDLASIP